MSDFPPYDREVSLLIDQIEDLIGRIDQRLEQPMPDDDYMAFDYRHEDDQFSAIEQSDGYWWIVLYNLKTQKYADIFLPPTVMDTFVERLSARREQKGDAA